MLPYLLPTFSILIITSLAFVHIPTSFCQEQQYVSCRQPFRCGNLNFSYPFWGGNRPSSCGYPGFELSCQNNVTFLASAPLRYRVLAINGSQQSLTVARDDLWSSRCPRLIYNTTFNSSIFTFSSGYQNLILSYGCTTLNPNISRQYCTANTTSNTTISNSTNAPGFNQTDIACNSTILVPVNPKAAQNLGSSAALQVVLNGGFGLQWKANNRNCDICSRSGGLCGYNSNTSSFVCYCSDRPYSLACNNTQLDNGSSGHSRRVGGIIGGTIGSILFAAGACYFVKIIWWKPNKENNQTSDSKASPRQRKKMGPKR